MGGFTVNDALIDNPVSINYIGNKINSKPFNWIKKLRVIFKNGELSNIGYYDGEGYFVLDDKSFFSYISPKKYKITDMQKKKYLDGDGYIILDKTYNLLKSNKKFNDCTKNKNLYTLLENFNNSNQKKTGPPSNYTSSQYVYYDPTFLNEDSILKKDIWAFTDPDINSKDGIKNKKRIEKIIDLFIKYSCKKDDKTLSLNISNNKIISLYYEFIDNKSNKYWHIQYNKDGNYKIKYGKIGSTGIIIEKTNKIQNIEKIIETKIKKGYKLIYKKNLKTFTI
jgi:predicted DNA-binding WGR domain protein